MAKRQARLTEEIGGLAVTNDDRSVMHQTTQELTVTKVGVIGGGAFGTALGMHAARVGHEVQLWARESSPVVSDINGPDRENKRYLPGFRVPAKLTATSDIDAVIAENDVIFLAVPSQHIEEVMAEHVHKFDASKVLVTMSKGIMVATLETVNEVLQRLFPPAFHSQLCYMSGPSFAKEVAENKPTAVTIASRSEDTAERVQALFSTSRFRCYRSSDVTGVEVGGALKNVLAIACGIADGLNFGANGRAALITRGLYEITRVATAKGANPLTMAGLAGMGDLVLTCTCDLSRNRTVGLRLGAGEKLPDIKASMSAVAEGIATSKSAFELSRQLGLDCPIIESIYRVIHEGADPVGKTDELMLRALSPEVGHDVISGAVSQGAQSLASSLQGINRLL